QTPLVSETKSATVPKGTRSITILLTSHDVDGGWNSGYADNLSLTLSKPASVTGPPTTSGSAIVTIAPIGLHGTPLHLPKPFSLTRHAVAQWPGEAIYKKRFGTSPKHSIAFDLASTKSTTLVTAAAAHRRITTLTLMLVSTTGSQQLRYTLGECLIG